MGSRTIVTETYLLLAGISSLRPPIGTAATKVQALADKGVVALFMSESRLRTMAGQHTGLIG